MRCFIDANVKIKTMERTRLSSNHYHCHHHSTTITTTTLLLLPTYHYHKPHQPPPSRPPSLSHHHCHCLSYYCTIAISPPPPPLQPLPSLRLFTAFNHRQQWTDRKLDKPSNSQNTQGKSIYRKKNI